MSATALSLPRRFASLVKFEHTVFALPFAYVGAFLAVDGVPSAHDLVWITVAMVGARSLAMGLNRLIDAGLDARNPRTATRELPSGLLSRGLAGVRGRALVVNLPGSPGGCRDGFEVLRPALEHAVELLAGEPTAHKQT